MSMNNLANVLSLRGNYEQAESLHQHVLGQRETVLGTQHPGTMTNMNNLADVLSDQGKDWQAEEMHQHIMELRTRVLGTSIDERGQPS
jgi:hypothetical protein